MSSRNGKSRIPEIAKRHEADLLADWLEEQTGIGIAPKTRRASCRA